MPLFNNDVVQTTPFGVNEFLRSTQDVKKKSATLAASTVPAQTIDGAPGQKILQPGTVLAKITSGPETGKVGPFVKAGAGTNEVQTLTGTTVTAGTYVIQGITYDEAGDTVDTAPIAFDATTADIQTAVDTATGVPGAVVVSGGPVNTTPVVLTYTLGVGEDVPAVTIDETNLTGTIAVTSAAGTAGITDGRTDKANIVGINSTVLPWQLTVGDCEVAVVYEASVVQGWCIEYTAAKPNGDVLSNDTASALRPDGEAKVNGVAILFQS